MEKHSETKGLTNTNYVDAAESVIKSMTIQGRDGKPTLKLTTSKIRNLLSLVNSLYNEVVHMRSEEITDEISGKLQYLRLRFAYESGRDDSVKDFVNKAQIINHIKNIRNRSDLLLFCRYMEALVAYHRFYGGKDK